MAASSSAEIARLQAALAAAKKKVAAAEKKAAIAEKAKAAALATNKELEQKNAVILREADKIRFENDTLKTRLSSSLSGTTPTTPTVRVTDTDVWTRTLENPDYHKVASLSDIFEDLPASIGSTRAILGPLLAKEYKARASIKGKALDENKEMHPIFLAAVLNDFKKGKLAFKGNPYKHYLSATEQSVWKHGFLTDELKVHWTFKKNNFWKSANVRYSPDFCVFPITAGLYSAHLAFCVELLSSEQIDPVHWGKAVGYCSQMLTTSETRDIAMTIVISASTIGAICIRKGHERQPDQIYHLDDVNLAESNLLDICFGKHWKQLHLLRSPIVESLEQTLDMVNLLGIGSHGKVYAGILQQDVGEYKKGTKVICKVATEKKYDPILLNEIKYVNKLYDKRAPKPWPWPTPIPFDKPGVMMTLWRNTSGPITKVTPQIIDSLMKYWRRCRKVGIINTDIEPRHLLAVDDGTLSFMAIDVLKAIVEDKLSGLVLTHQHMLESILFAIWSVHLSDKMPSLQSEAPVSDPHKARAGRALEFWNTKINSLGELKEFVDLARQGEESKLADALKEWIQRGASRSIPVRQLILPLECLTHFEICWLLEHEKEADEEGDEDDESEGKVEKKANRTKSREESEENEAEDESEGEGEGEGEEEEEEEEEDDDDDDDDDDDEEIPPKKAAPAKAVPSKVTVAPAKAGTKVAAKKKKVAEPDDEEEEDVRAAGKSKAKSSRQAKAEPPKGYNTRSKAKQAAPKK